jgi:hypothetical protein
MALGIPPDNSAVHVLDGLPVCDAYVTLMVRVVHTASKALALDPDPLAVRLNESTSADRSFQPPGGNLFESISYTYLR